jgi:hypothetical protein
MIQTYRHTQFGTVIVATLAGAFLLTAGLISIVGVPLAAVRTSLIILGVCALLFPTLTTEVEPEHVRCFFGLGLIRRSIALRDIAKVEAVRNSWVTGWGIRLIPDGWMWNVSGYHAIELTLRTGRRFRIGTDEPDALLRALQAYMPRS